MIIGVQDFIAGWIAGTNALAIGHPFDTIKVRQQVLHTKLLSTIRYTFQLEGIRGFYKGFLLPALMIGPSNAIFFGFYGGTMRYIGKEGQTGRVDLEDPNWKRNVFLAGIFAGFWQVIFTCPAELVKTTLQMQTQHKGIWKAQHESDAKGIIDCLIKIWRGPGFTWYFRGITPMMYRDCPTSGVYTLVYEWLLNCDYGYGVFNQKLIRQSFAGGTAGLISWIAVVPFDVIKSKMQGDNMNSPKFRNMFHCFVSTYHEHGLQYFFKGTLPLLIRSFPVNVVTFVTYEFVMDMFKIYG